MEQNKYRAFAYYRLSKEDYNVLSHTAKSTVKIKDESNSIKNQKGLIKHFLAGTTEIKLISEFTDDGYSGLYFERPGFQQMMQVISDSDVNCIIVKDFSRLGRDYLETSRYIDRIFPALGIRFISVNDDYDSAGVRSQADNLTIPVKNLINDTYSRDSSIRIRSHIEIKKMAGDYIAPFAVYGYFKNRKNSILYPDPYAASVVREIFQLKIKGLSQKKIASLLNEKGVLSPLEYKRYIGSDFYTVFKTKDKAAWSENSISRILKDEVYTGTAVQGKVVKVSYKSKKQRQIPKEDWIKVYNTHEAIIDQDTFRVVQRLFEVDTRIAPGKELIYPLSGLLLCADCGESMVRKVEKHKDNTYVYYICSTSKNKNTCSSHRIREDKLFGIIVKTLNKYIEILFDMQEADTELNKKLVSKDQWEKLDKELQIVQSEEVRIKKTKMSLYEDLKSGILDNKDYEELKFSYTQDLEHLNSQIKVLKNKLNNFDTTQKVNLAWSTDFIKSHKLERLDRPLVANMIHHIEIFKNQAIKMQFYYIDEFQKLDTVIKKAGENY